MYQFSNIHIFVKVLQNIEHFEVKVEKAVKHTHVEVICVWVINHLNEINNIRMIQHFHY